MQEKLMDAGLSGNEAKVYLELLKTGSISAQEISKRLGMDRTLAYQVLNNIIEKGLASYIIKENKKYFEAASPDNLLNNLKEKELIIASIIPNLKSIQKIEKDKNEVNIYEGKKGLRTLMTEFSNARDFCSFGGYGGSYEVLKFEMPHFAEFAIQKKLKGRVIVSKDITGHPMTKLPNIDVRILKGIESTATTTIFGDKISIHVLTEKPLVIIIKNKIIAQSYKSHFEVLWRVAKPLLKIKKM